MRRSESSLERALVRKARDLGLLAYKLHERNAPDRLFLGPRGVLFFVEFKRSGEKPRPEQAHEIERLEAMGYRVHVISSAMEGWQIIEYELYGE